MDVQKKLQEAIRSGEVLKVKYHGGSQPGSIRDIAPISVKSGKVRALCYTSNAVKTFSIDKIEILEGSAAQKEATWDINKENIVNYVSLEQLWNEKLSELESLGWHVEYNETTLSLHRRFKNGKPLKGSDVSINFEEFDYDYIAGENGEIHKENERKRVRPWVVRAKNKDTVTYGKLDKAVSLLLEHANALAPK
jgi:predicted DNA-binding transcriptional regulator YafY